ncbi:major facilitator superfamily domain-containing protein 2B [Protopterus annectens]|uniref:major facilitator superfamily domain-containing protein 2B n=1 Tax=Protopterus annectens TaxID=7888 RepID=UPI001CFBE488|nr:major facilitator superfamily domain-containing protein 2B [Protopterus annectens]
MSRNKQIQHNSPAILINHNASQFSDEAEENEEDSQLSRCSKLSYGIGAVPNQVSGSASAFYLQIYLLDVAQISPSDTSLVLFTGKAWGSITDPLIGFFVSKSQWTRIGRLMPWIIGCTPFVIASYCFLWYVPSFMEKKKVIWYLGIYCLFQAMVTCFHVPYSALSMFLSPDPKQRESAITYRMTAEVVGTLIGAAIQGQIVSGAHSSVQCSQYNISNDIALNTTNISDPLRSISTLLHSPEFLFHAKELYIIAAGVIGGIYLVCTVVLFIGVKEIDDPYALKSDKAVPFLEGFKHVMKHGPCLKLIAAFLFISAAVNLEQSNFILFCTHAVDLREHFQNIVLVLLVSAALSIPFWKWFSQRFGKKTASFGIFLMIPFIFMLVSIPELIVAYVVAVTSGISISASLLLPWLMLPDVIDDFRQMNPHAKGHEAIVYSFYVFSTKLAAGISLGISNLCLHFAGYNTGACVQPLYVALTLKILIGVAPAVLIVTGLFILIFYPITEASRNKTKKKLDHLRKLRASQDNLDEIGSVL